MRILAAILLALSTSGCIPIVYTARYEEPSRQNLPDAVPAFIESGRTSMADVLLALGDPDTVAVDESWIAYVSRYREGGGGAALVLVGGGNAGLLGGALKAMLNRRLLVRFDAAGIVTSAKLDLVDCTDTEFFLGSAAGTSAPCFDVESREIAAEDLATRLRNAGETNIVVYPRAEWLPTHQKGMVAVSDTTLHFVATGLFRRPEFPDAHIALADLTAVIFAGHSFHLTEEGRQRVVLERVEEQDTAFVIQAEYADDANRTGEAAELIRQRMGAIGR
jgi:hypothetical protein